MGGGEEGEGLRLRRKVNFNLPQIVTWMQFLKRSTVIIFSGHRFRIFINNYVFYVLYYLSHLPKNWVKSLLQNAGNCILGTVDFKIFQWEHASGSHYRYSRFHWSINPPHFYQPGAATVYTHLFVIAQIEDFTEDFTGISKRHFLATTMHWQLWPLKTLPLSSDTCYSFLWNTYHLNKHDFAIWW